MSAPTYYDGRVVQVGDLVWYEAGTECRYGFVRRIVAPVVQVATGPYDRRMFSPESLRYASGSALPAFPVEPEPTRTGAYGLPTSMM